jgi:hypothetical protein
MRQCAYSVTSSASVANVRAGLLQGLQLSACPTIVDFIGYLFTNIRQFKKLLLDKGVFGLFSKLSIFGCLVS